VGSTKEFKTSFSTTHFSSLWLCFSLTFWNSIGTYGYRGIHLSCTFSTQCQSCSFTLVECASIL
jgi:hypothetical protein